MRVGHAASFDHHGHGLLRALRHARHEARECVVPVEVVRVTPPPRVDVVRPPRIVTALLNEIDRLESRSAWLEQRLRSLRPKAVVPDHGAPLNAPVGHATRSYSPPALGAVTPDRDAGPPPAPEPARISAAYHVTNLGTLLDVLA